MLIYSVLAKKTLNVRKRYGMYLRHKMLCVKVLYVSSYIPKKCGIATYTKDLTNAVNLLNPERLAEIIAIDDPLENLPYPWEVTHKISEDDLLEYKRMAEQVNTSGADVLTCS